METDRDNETARLIEQIEVPERPPQFVERLLAAHERERQEEAARHRRRRRWSLAAVAVCAALAVALLGVRGLPLGGQSGLEPASAAARMAAKMTSALATAHSISGGLTYVTTDYHGKTLTQRGSFAATSAGDKRLELTEERQGNRQRTWVDVYNAERRAVTSYFVNPAGRGFGNQIENIPYLLGWSNADALFDFVPGFAAQVRAAVESGDPALSVQATSFDGRPAWRTSLRRGSEAAWFTIDLVVDQQSGFAVWFAIESHGAQDHQREVWQISNLVVDGQLSSGLFSTRVPDHVRLRQTPYDMRFHVSTLAQAASRVGRVALAPRDLPTGFSLLWAASLRSDLGTMAWADSRAGLDLGGRSSPRLPDTALQLQYGRGFERLMVAAAPVSKGTVGNQPQSNPLDYRWAEKMVSERGISPRHDRLTDGYFNGCIAYTWFDSNGVNLAVSRRGVVVQISGDATRAEVIAAANSLERVTQ